MAAPLSVLIPTFNEEALIAQAINSSKFADEILVIDSYSSDATVAIAKKNGCKVLQRTFDNFSNQKNYAISKAKHDWILVLDADEFITYTLRNEILAAIENPKHRAYKMLFKNYFMNRFIHHGSNGNKLKLRLFHRKYCTYKGLVHEELICEGSIGVLQGKILHYTYRNLWHFFQKKNQYSRLQSKQLLKKNKKISLLTLLFKPFYRFLNEYLFRLGFLDGVAGLTSTVMNGYGVLSRYVRLLILKEKINNKDLLEYDTYTENLLKSAKKAAYNQDIKKPISIVSLVGKPFLSFLNFYFLRLNFTRGKTGFILSYLNSFRDYNELLYKWLRRRNME